MNRMIVDQQDVAARAEGPALAATERTGTLFGRHPGSARYADGVDPLAPALEETNDAETGAEIERHGRAVMDGFMVDREDVVALIEDAAKTLTGGDKMEAVALAMRRLLAQQRRPGTLYGALEGTIIFHDDVDLTAPVLDGELDALTGRELER